MANQTVLEPDVLLERVHEETLHQFIPVIVSLSLLSLIGIVGNGFTIGFYGFHARLTPTVFMITCLSVVDLSVCLILIHAIVEIAINVYYTNPVTCKILHFLVHWAIAASVLILGLVSIDRFRRICRPFNKQISITLAKRLVIGVVVFAFVLSIRDFVNFDIIDFPLSTDDNTTVTTGHYCTTTDDPSYKINVTIFIGIDALLFVAVMVTLVVTYGSVVWTICKTRAAAKQSENIGVRDSSIPVNDIGIRSSSEMSTNVDTDKSTVTIVEETTSASNDSTPDQTSAQIAKPMDGNPDKTKEKRNLKQSERHITFLMIIVSIGFFITFVPYFVIKLGVRSIKRASDLELGAGTQFGIRLVYLNSVINPLIFCVFNPQFRKYIRETFSRIRLYRHETESSTQATVSTGKEPSVST